MASVSINAPGTGFISDKFSSDSSDPARLCITAETDDFDAQTLRDWHNEGFDVVYLAYENGGKEYLSKLNDMKEGLGVGEQYAVIGMASHYPSFIHLFIISTNTTWYSIR